MGRRSLKQKYANDYTGNLEQFTWPAGTLIFPCALTWLTGAIINRFTIPANERVAIPDKKSAKCGLMVSISTLTYSYAVLLTNYPVVQMFKSCNLISVLLVGLCCSQVRDKKLKMTTKKLVVGIIITFGIIIFKYFDPAVKQSESKTEIAGIALLVISFMADGFLPDFQAEIKSVEKPTPMEMLAEINKWVTIISLIYSCVLLEIWDICLFLVQHWRFSLDLFIYAMCGTVGQMFVYRMIKQFKQHFVPFVITTRKIFTVALSLIWYQHPTNAGQISGILLVFALVTYEFVSELVEEKRRENEAKPPVGAATDLSLEREVEEPKGGADEREMVS